MLFKEAWPYDSNVRLYVHLESAAHHKCVYNGHADSEDAQQTLERYGNYEVNHLIQAGSRILFAYLDKTKYHDNIDEGFQTSMFD